MPDAAQAQEAVVFSLGFSGYEAVRTKTGSTETSSGLEDARLLLDRSSSSIAEDMRGEVQLSWRRVGTWPTADPHLATARSSHDTKIASHETDTNVADTKKRRDQDNNAKYVTIVP
jgi:hypothetical protein